MSIPYSVRRSAPALLAAALLVGCANQAAKTSLHSETINVPPSPPVSVPTSAGPNELVHLALQRNPTLRSMRNRIERLQQKSIQDRSLPDPTLEVAAGSMAETAAGRTETMASLKQKIPFPGKLREASAASNSEAEAAARDLEAMELKIAEQVRTAWWNYYLSSETTRLTNESQELLKSVIDSVGARVSAGKGSQADQLRLANESAELDRDLTESRRMTATAKARLNSLLDRNAGASLPAAHAAGLPSNGSLDSLLARAAAHHPEIEAAKLRNVAYQHKLARAKLEKFPDLIVGISGASISDSGLSRMSNGRDQIFGTIGINLPLWQEPRKAMIREAESGLFETEALVDSTKADLRYRIEEAWNRASAAQEIIGFYETRMIPDANQAHEAALAAYTTDQAPFNDVIDTWRKLLTYKLQLVATRSQLGKADAALRSAAALDSFNKRP